MNKTRRASIKKILETVRSVEADLNTTRDAEQVALDNMPESMWDTDRYAAMEEAVENLDCAVDSFYDLVSYLEEAIG